MAKKVFEWCGYVLIGFILIGIILPKNHDLSEYEPKIACEMAGEKQLKAPSTAKFSDLRETFVKTTKDEKNEKSFVVKGWVEAQNSFGVPLRSSYLCTLTSKRPNEKSDWKTTVTAFVLL
jgi:hypothetical protein